MRKLLALLFVGAVGILLLYVVAFMPPMGDGQSPANRHLAPYYRDAGLEDTGSHNLVTGVTINYRGYDALAKVTVIFTALAALLAILGRERKGRGFALPDTSPIRPSPAVLTAVKLVVPFILLFSIYIIVSGEISPGGGFQGGAIIGASLILYTTVFGLSEATGRIPRAFRFPLEGSAVLTVFCIGLAGIAGGATFLTYLLPRLSAQIQPEVRQWMTMLAEIGIGVGDAVVLISLLFALSREEELVGGK
jgi:multisubunit Na+/H+ antiporter MnhB subunit